MPRGVKKIEVIEPESFFHKYLFFFVVLFILFFVLIFFLIFSLSLGEVEEVVVKSKCGDGSFYNTCSLDEPYYCENGFLFERASFCGCPERLNKEGDSCFSNYYKEPRTIDLKYILRGEEGIVDFVVYEGLTEFLSKQPRDLFYLGDEEPLRRDFKLKDINQEEQRLAFMDLVKKIQDKSLIKDDQARIAISLVQNIEFGASDRKIKFAGGEVDYSRYPYEVLSEGKGICGEKSTLLALLLRELGYGVVLFYHEKENHESLGIKCSLEESYKGTGYCFVETTGPAIISDSQIAYVGGIWLNSIPQIMIISDGISFGENNFYEVDDANTLQKIRTGDWVLFGGSKFGELKEKYGLVEGYNA